VNLDAVACNVFVRQMLVSWNIVVSNQLINDVITTLKQNCSYVNYMSTYITIMMIMMLQVNSIEFLLLDFYVSCGRVNQL